MVNEKAVIVDLIDQAFDLTMKTITTISMKLSISGVLRVFNCLDYVVATNQGCQFKRIQSRVVESIAFAPARNNCLYDIDMAFEYSPEQRKVAFVRSNVWICA